MATFNDWLVICHARVPVVERLGVSMPAVTTKLESTKADMRKGRRTGRPVSGWNQWTAQRRVAVRKRTDLGARCYLSSSLRSRVQVS